jgi:hypothetical protein
MGADYSVVITDDQRQLAELEAHRRQVNHTVSGHRDNQADPAGASGEEQHRKGLLGELEFANVFGVQPDLDYRPRGDGGADYRLTLCSGKVITVDVKTSSYRGPDPRIKVPVGKIHAETVYVAARLCANFLETSDDAELVGWITGAELLARNEIRQYTRIANYAAAYEDLHPLEPLIMITA